MNQQSAIGSDDRLTQIDQTLDVLIVGAGISGICAARYLKVDRPGDSFAVLDDQESFGGTWQTHRYPGIRSDSDLHTFGYGFKPWVGPPIATAEEIRAYMGETIAENDLGDAIHYGWRVGRAEWSSRDSLWTVEAVRAATGQRVQLRARFLWMCQGYYRHSRGYTPDWPGMDDFGGDVIHPQHWPEDYDYSGRRMVVIGSGATAATLVPNVAEEVAHVTMLQRSPTWFASERNEITIASQLRNLQVDEAWIHEIVRRQILVNSRDFATLCFEKPEQVKADLLENARKALGDDYDLATHFTPTYDPWRQRLARIPNGDLFKAIASGKASVVTDHIERFETGGIRLRSGALLETDVVVTATGFDLCAFGDIGFAVDGRPVDFHDTVGYRGMMFTGVPNLVWVMGYFRSSWTLRAEIIAQFVTRLLGHMRDRQAASVVPQVPDPEMELFDWAEEDDFNPGYLMRGQHLLPKRGAETEWKLSQDYCVEKDDFAAIDLESDVFRYG